MKKVGAYEAKTHFGQLLSEVERGETVTVTRRGIPVAVIKAPDRLESVEETIAAIRRERIGTRLNGLDLKQLIREGRRY